MCAGLGGDRQHRAKRPAIEVERGVPRAFEFPADRLVLRRGERRASPLRVMRTGSE